MDEVTIRDATDADLPAMCVLWRAFMTFHAVREPHLTPRPDGDGLWTPFVRELLASPEGVVLVAARARRIVGHLLGSVREKPPPLRAERCGHVFDLAVAEDDRRRGVGERLLAEATRRFSSRGITRMETYVAVTNEVSTAFWRKQGYGDFMRMQYRDLEVEPGLRLVEPDAAYLPAFLAMARETQAAAETRYAVALDDPPAFLERVRAQERGERLAPGLVPWSTYWTVTPKGRVVGSVHLRHRLSPQLEVEGGHIGYAIRPSDRRKGYGTRQLALALEKAQDRGIGRVLVTCDDDNVGSIRVIENNGGVRGGTGTSPRTGKAVRRYWFAQDAMPSAGPAGRRRR